MAKKIIIYIALLGGFMLTGWGVTQQDWPRVMYWNNVDTYWNFAGFLCVGVLLVIFAAKKLRMSPFAVGAILASGVALLAGAGWPYLVVVWFALASIIVGQYALELLRVEKANSTLTTHFLVGSCIYGTIVGLAAHFPVNYVGIYGLALMMPILLGWRRVVSVVTQVRTWLQSTKDVNSRIDWLSALIVAVGLYHFVVSLMPELGADALAMHLFIPGHLAHRHEWGFDVTTYVWAVMPMLGDWIFSIVYMLGGEQGARLINVGFIFVLGWLIRELVMWAGGNAVGSRWAVILFLTTPLTFTVSSSLYIESVWATFVIAGSLLVFKSLQPNASHASHLPVAGILLGGALAAKAVTFPILPVLLFPPVLRYRTWAHSSLVKALALCLVLFFAIGAIPYITAWYLTGNPVFPFFNQIFQSPLWPSIAFDQTMYGKGVNWDTLYQVTFHTERFLEARAGGAAGFQWLLLFIPAFLIVVFSRNYRGALLFVVAALAIAITFQSTAYLRYVFPSFVWVCAGIGVALSVVQVDPNIYKKALQIFGLIAVILNLAFFKSGTYYGGLSLQPLISQSGREVYLNNRRPIRNAIALVNLLNVERTPVAVFAAPSTAGLKSDGLYPIWYNYIFEKKFAEAATSTAVAQVLLEKNVDYIILDKSWKRAKKIDLIEDATEKLAEFGSLSVRKVKTDYRFKTELLRNSEFKTIVGWRLSPEAKYDPDAGVILASASSSAFQGVAVSPSGRYLNAVVARCAKEPALGRVQVNWIDVKKQLVKVDIKTFKCSPTWAEHAMEVTAPPNTTNAVVYVTGHTSIPLEFKSNSLRQ